MCQKSIKLNIRQQDVYRLPCILFRVFSERGFDSSLFSCRFMLSLEGQLVNSQAPEIAIYLCTYLRTSFHRSGANQGYFITAHSRVPLWSSMNKRGDNDGCVNSLDTVHQFSEP